jgi:hypothetical protein
MLAKIVALADAGIYDPVRTELANQPYVTPEYVRAHRLEARNVRLAIYRMRHAWPAPLNRFGHLLGCECDECAPPSVRVAADGSLDSTLHEPDGPAVDVPPDCLRSLDAASGPADPDVPHEAAQAWLTARDGLAMEMSHETFDRWLAGVRLIGFEADCNRFMLEARDGFVKAWLDLHVRFGLGRVLTTLLNRPALAEFVVAGDASRIPPIPRGSGIAGQAGAEGA